MEPVTLAVLGSRPMIAIDDTDLPEPDSPTMPSTCRVPRVKETLRTACTVPSSVPKPTERSSTTSSSLSSDLPRPTAPDPSSSGFSASTAPSPFELLCRAVMLAPPCGSGGAASSSCAHPLLPRVERVTQTVADEVRRQRDENDEHEREPEQPGMQRDLQLVLVDQQPERRVRWMHAQPDERQRRLGQHRLGHRDRGVHDDDVQRVGQDVPEHQPADPATQGAGRLDEL